MTAGPLSRLARSPLHIGVAVMLALAGGALAWSLMPTGPVLGHDSLTYVGVARNIASGEGVTSPFGHELSGLSPDDSVERVGHEPLTPWPPLYPMVLAAGSPLSVSVESMARLVNAISLAVVIVMMALLVHRSGAGPVAGGAAAALFGVNIATMVTFVGLASEPLYMALQVAALVAALAVTSRVTWARVLTFVALAAAAALTRFIGVSVIGAGALIICLAAPLPRAKRALLGAGVAAAAALPLIVWMIGVARQPGFRGGLAYTSRWNELRGISQAAANWVVPQEHMHAAWGTIAAAVLALVAVGASAVVVVRMRSAGPSRSAADQRPEAQERRWSMGTVTIALLVFQAATYLAFLLFAASMIDHGIPFGYRMLIPLAPPCFVILASAADHVVRAIPAGVARTVAGVSLSGLALATIVVTGHDTMAHVPDPGFDGIWAPIPSSPTVEAIKALPAGTLIFTNQPSAVYALTGRPAVALPTMRSRGTGQENPDADRDVDQLVAMLRGRDDVVVVYEKQAAFFDTGQLLDRGGLSARVDLIEVADDPGYVLLRPNRVQ